MAARAGVEPMTLWLKAIDSTKAPPCPTASIVIQIFHSYVHQYALLAFSCSALTTRLSDIPYNVSLVFMLRLVTHPSIHQLLLISPVLTLDVTPLYLYLSIVRSLWKLVMLAKTNRNTSLSHS